MDSIIQKDQYRHYLLSNAITFAASYALGLLLNYLCTGGINVLDPGKGFLWAVQIFPAMMLAVLCGSPVAMCIEFILLIFCTIKGNATTYYRTTPVLIASIISFLPVRKRWYLSKKGTLRAILVQLLATSAALGITDSVNIGYVPNLLHTFQTLLICLPNAIAIPVLSYLFFNYAPDRVLSYFYSGIFYINARHGRAGTHLKKTELHNYLGRKILLLILAETSAIIISVIMFIFILFSNHSPDAAHIVEAVPEMVHKDVLMRLSLEQAMHLKQLLSLLNIAISVAIVANFYAQLTIVNPIKLLAVAVDDFTHGTIDGRKGQHFNLETINISTKDEITDLYQALITMSSTITDYIDNVQREKQLEQDLRVATEAGKAKSAFLANMSHEIRTPINAVLGLDEMILRESTNKQILMYATEIQSAGRSLLGIINDILDFSKIESGKMEILPVKYDASSSLNDLMNMISQRAAEKGISFNINVDSTMPHLLYGDEIRIKQCITNILTNSVKYTEKGSVTLDLSWRDVGNDEIMIGFRVKDTGIGMKKEDLPRLFEAFERLEESRNRRIEGTGLGMNIVHDLLALMDSKLHVESEYGKGSEFFFELKQKVLDRAPIGDFMTTYRKSLESNKAYRESFRAPNAHILVVDDTRLNLVIFKELLKQTQVQIDTVESGQEALVKAMQEDYDIIFIDHRMPGMDGVETLHALKGMATDKNKDKPCIAQTANAVNGAREMYLKEGFTDYITKPIDCNKLEAMIVKYLPPELVQVVSREDEPEQEEEEPLPVLDGIDTAAALKNCGSRSLFIKTAQLFHESIGEKSALIEQYAAEGDIKNYTVLVHALKSSARLIGATGLSNFAAEMEKKGDAGDAAEITARTPRLLELYRGYGEKLAPLCTGSGEPKKPISEKEYRQALAELKTCVEAFDYATADQVAAMLGECTLPDGEEEHFAQIRKALAEVDYGKLEKLL